jgi:hypothetical protein
LAKVADSIVFASLETNEATLYDKWKSSDGKQMLSFTDGKEVFFKIKKSILLDTTNLELGRSFLFYKSPYSDPKKLPKMIAAYKLEQEPWSSLPNEVAIVDYVNSEKQIAYAYSPQGGASTSETPCRDSDKGSRS